MADRDTRDSHRDKDRSGMPWEVQARLDCLDLACSQARQRGIVDVTVQADKFLEWVLRPLPAPSQPRKDDSGEAQRPAA